MWEHGWGARRVTGLSVMSHLVRKTESNGTDLADKGGPGHHAVAGISLSVVSQLIL